MASLRKADAGFDGQMEAVKKLLIVAGQSDLGAGLPGTEVDLTGVKRLLPLPDGTLLIATAARVWKLGADGKLQTFMNPGTLFDAALDDQHRLLVLRQAAQGFEVVRHDDDGDTPVGTLTGTSAASAVFPGANGAALVVAGSGSAGTLPSWM